MDTKENEKEELANLWEDPSMKELIINKIKETPEYKMETDYKRKQKLISDQVLIQEYWKLWIKIDDQKEPYRKLSNHPSLTLIDFNEINQIVMKYREKQFYWASGCTALTLTIYSTFLHKNRVFYNFFRKKSKYRGVNFMKKSLSCLGVFWSWLLILNYFFDKQIPFDLKEKHFFDKYNIDFQTS